MKLIANENFQVRGMHRAGVTLTVSKQMLTDELKKGRHPNEIRGRHAWMSGLIEHCTPANDETANFISEFTGEKEVETDHPKHDENDNSDEIREIRAKFDAIGKAYDKRWQLERLRNEIVKAEKAVGEPIKDKEESLNIKE
ncbi:MAG: hypothetical protein PF495_19490 [Spirochaetales bacterium]|jgi:hypothetical protein|nr:hypothetical protein [Spirochaetales bacterium]